MEPTNWAPEHSDALREHLARGMSYAEIVRAINAKFNTFYSRSATIGRARRMGLAATARPSDGSSRTPTTEQPNPDQLREHCASVWKWPVPDFEPAELPKLRCVDIEPRHLSLLDLKPGDCRYPYGGDAEGEAITFCGHPQREESSYCAAHFRLTQGPGALPARTFSAAVLRIVEGA